MPPASRGGILGSMMGPKSAASFRPKEKYLIFMVLATFGFVCFGAIFFLPTEKSMSQNNPNQAHMNRVYKVYKDLQAAGQDILLPAPPIGKCQEHKKQKKIVTSFCVSDDLQSLFDCLSKVKLVLLD